MLHSSGYTAHPFLLFLGKYPTKMHIVASKDMYKDVHSNIIHYRPKLKQSIMSINKHLGMLCSNDGILHHSENQQTTATHNRMGKSHRCGVLSKKIQEYSLSDLII